MCYYLRQSTARDFTVPPLGHTCKCKQKIELFATFPFHLSVAMYSNKLANFESDYDLVALGIQNVWICEVGSKEMHGSFENFTTFILNSSVSIYFPTFLLEF